LIVRNEKEHELYDLRVDPQELHDLCRGPSQVLSGMRREIDQRLEALRYLHKVLGGGEDPSAVLAPETVERLKQLGYLGR
jgi:hypothetical protein